jgi:CubicO group peptidase (beta-lactamase class C family)
MLRCPLIPSRRLSLVFLGILLPLISPVRQARAGEGEFQWQAAEPQAHGLSRAKLDALRDDLARRGTVALLVIRHDRIVYEWYAPGVTQDKPQGTASLAKALVGGISLAVAMQDRRITPEDRASQYIPQWRDDPRKSKITVGQLATHTSGLSDAEEDGIAHDKLPGWKGAFWKRQPDPFTISRDDAPVLFEPGERVSYSNPGMAMLSYAVTASLREGAQKDVRSLLRERIYRPIGIGDREWSIGYGQTYRVGGLDLVANWGGGAFTPRAAARIGRLMLREGDWDGKRLLDAKVVRRCIWPADVPLSRAWQGDGSPRPGYGWWNNLDHAWPGVPRDAFCGAGAGHQVLLVIPSLDMIVVRNGAALAGKDEGFWAAAVKHLLTPIAATVTDPPVRPSDAIRAVRFDPPEAIVRKAIDSDNWPITWGDDDRLYTAYGDGRGFEPFVERKLSLGLARVEGTPREFRGVNLRSQTAERTGDGPRGPKASGLLMVDGTLYMWVRNTGNATLAWSADHGQTWTWGLKLDTSFGCPTFLNFGRNYAGAWDDFVYTYSQDGPGAYQPYDGVVLARAPKSRLHELVAYEFYAGDDGHGASVWTKEIEKRQPTFRYPGHCERLDVVYDPGLKRYLMTVDFGHGKGWGLFDAPEPWGPWTVAWSTTDWGQGETHDYRLPSKWISPDGTELWLVFSGRKANDAFCVRRMVLEPYPPVKR